jgi:hypothetical protein
LIFSYFRFSSNTTKVKIPPNLWSLLLFRTFFKNFLKHFISLKKLYIKKIDFSGTTNATSIRICSFVVANLHQFEEINFPLVKFIDSFQCQKDYPQTRFRWYVRVQSKDENERQLGIYEGDFRKKNDPDENSKFEGKGVLYLNCGNGQSFDDRFEGEWKNGEIYIGKVILGGRKKYEGEFKNYKKEGKGILFHLNGKKYYEGEWKYGKQDGSGIAYNFNGDMIYEGGWKNGAGDGIGIYYYPCGDIYEGEFKNNIQDGKGKMIYFDGRVIEGEWKNGENVRNDK